MEMRKKSIIIALMVAMFLGAVEGTVVTTATPSIVKDLHGFESISMVFSIYLLTTALSTPIYGKLSDLFGRANILSIGIIIFLFGSFLCGISQNMYMLIICRAIQGLGAGSIFTVTYTIVGDVFTLEERPKIQGWISTVWGVASMAGPFLGGFLIDTLSWHWIFFINLPFGILSIILLKRSLKEDFEKKKHKIDYLGTALLSGAVVILLNIFMSNGIRVMKQSLFIPISILAVFILIVLFYFVERKAKEPIMPFELFTKTSTIINVISFLSAGILIGIDVYMPVYIQNVLGYNATISGLSLAPMSIAWLIASVLLGYCIMKFGGKAVMIVSNIILLFSTLLLMTLNANSTLLLVICCTFLMGIGLGGALTTLTIVIQSSVDYNQRGAATATNSLLRTLGQTIGVSIFGGVLNIFIIKYFTNIGISGINPANLYSKTESGIAATASQIKLSLNSSLHMIFLLQILLAALCLILSFTLPKLHKNSLV